MIIDGMMHLKVVGERWEGIFEEILEYYDATGIDKGVIMTTWMPSAESNDHWEQWQEMPRFCDLARSRENVYLDTSGVRPYFEFGKAFEYPPARPFVTL